MFPTDKSTSPLPPLLWLWTCHVCKRTYPLGATRRCLEDGHFFCAGISEIKRPRRGSQAAAAAATSAPMFRRHTPCSSEFDYAGWKTWGEWRRGKLDMAALTQRVERGRSHGGGCADYCDFPSQCRRRQSAALALDAVKIARSTWML
jgi:hypothetical protein